MTISLKKAFSEAAKLSEQEQNCIAEIILAEIASEKKWEELFNSSEKVLSELAMEALSEIHNRTHQR